MSYTIRNRSLVRGLDDLLFRTWLILDEGAHLIRVDCQLRSCEPAVAPLSRGGSGPVERRTGSPALTHRQSRLDASARRPSPRSRQISTADTRRSLYRCTWEPRS